MNTKSIKVKTAFQLHLSIPIIVRNIPITSVVWIWVYQKGNNTNEFTHDGYEVLDYEDTPEQMNDERGVFNSDKANEFKQAYKTIYGSNFDDDIDIEIAKIMTEEFINRIVEESKPNNIVTSIDDINTFYLINKKHIK